MHDFSTIMPNSGFTTYTMLGLAAGWGGNGEKEGGDKMHPSSGGAVNRRRSTCCCCPVYSHKMRAMEGTYYLLAKALCPTTRKLPPRPLCPLRPAVPGCDEATKPSPLDVIIEGRASLRSSWARERTIHAYVHPIDIYRC